jgi:hypothetical protein
LPKNTPTKTRAYGIYLGYLKQILLTRVIFMDQSTISKRISQLFIRQAVDPSFIEKVFLESLNSRKFFHRPIPNNANIRIVPAASELKKALASQARNYSALNSCCHALYRSCEELFENNIVKTNDESRRVLSIWGKDIHKFRYLSTPSHYLEFTQALNCKTDMLSTPFSRMHTMVKALPESLVYSWNISFKIAVTDTDQILGLIAQTEIYKENKLYFIEFSNKVTNNMSAHFIATVVLSKQLSFKEVIEYFILHLSPEKLFISFEAKNTHKVVNPRMKCERGSKVAKQLISDMTMLDLFYLPDFKYSFSKNKDILQYRSLINSKPDISKLLSI